MIHLTSKDIIRFECKYMKGTPNECWEWVASKHPFGYGYFQMRGSTKLAHIVSYNLYIGEIPEGLCVLHSCDNPSCVNPNHFFLGTRTDNAIDKVKKGRQKGPIGNRNAAKINFEIADQIREEYKTGLITQKELGKKYHLHDGTIREITKNRSWIRS